MVAQITAGATKTIPGLREPPLIGSLYAYNRDRLGFLLRMARECGDIGVFHYGPFPLYAISSPELVHDVLVELAEDFNRGAAVHNAFSAVLGNGLFTSEGDFHRRQRKLMAPSFQPRHIVSYADAMVKYGEQIQQGWRDGETIDVGQEMIHATMSIVGKVLFDADVFTETGKLGAAMTTVLEQINYALSHLFPVPPGWPTPRNQRVKRALALLDGRIQKMIDERRASASERNDFLSVLLTARGEDGERMSDRQVRDEAVTLFGAGHETTATALTWAWYLLATHPEIYQKVQQEVDEALKGRSPSHADLVRLPYTLQVFKEAMRLYPPAYGIVRVPLHDIALEGYPLRKGTITVIATYAIHHRPDYFPDPEEFRPERFTPEREKRLPRYAYMPFGAGPRICIGNHFATMEGHLLLAALAQRVTFELTPGQRVVPEPNRTITIRPKYPMKMIVHRRDAAYK
jgi:cytochrome P450